MFINREYYVALSVSHPVSTRDTNIIPRELFPYHIPYQPETPISSRELSSLGMILVSRVDMGCDTERAISYYVYHILRHESLVLYYELWRRRSHVINIILRGMIKRWWYWYQSRQTNTIVMFFQYYMQYANFLSLVLSIW
jgi:hypothetical protein